MKTAAALRSTDPGKTESAAEMQRVRTTQVIIGVVAAVAAALCAYQLSRSNMLFGVTEYDDGAYFGSAVRLVHGALPYRDFVLVQPPGFTILVTPLALLSRAIGTRDALATARLLMPLVAALNVVLVGMLVRHRGQLTTLLAAGVMAVFPAEVHATHTLLLEPFLDLFCLLGALLVFRGDRLRDDRRRLLLGGIALGFAGTIKGWAVIPVVVILLLCLPQVRHRLVPVLGGVAMGFAVPTLPFALLAPGSFYREVIATQLRRIGNANRVPVGTRLGDLTGSSSSSLGAHGSTVLGVVLIAVMAAVIVAGHIWPRRRLARFDWFVLVSMVAIGVLLLTPAEFYDHYAAFYAPFLAMALGSAVGVLCKRLHRWTALTVAAIVVGALGLNQARIMSAERGIDLTGSVATIIPPGACALSDSSAFLLTVNRFVSTVASCNVVVADPYGTSLANGGSHSAQSVGLWRRTIAGADYVVLYSLRNGRIPLVAPIRAELAKEFHLQRASPVLVYIRDGYPG